MTAGRRRIRDLVAAALFIGLLVFLFWPEGSDEPDSEAAPDGVAELEELTPETIETPIPRRELSCEDDYGPVRLLNSFVAAVNSGDREVLDDLFPDQGAESPITRSYSGMNQNQLHSFRIHESGAMTDPAQVIDYLDERVHEFNERWRMDDVEVERMGRSQSATGDALDRLTVGFHRYADDSHSHDIYGEIVLNCYQQQVLLVEMQADDPTLALPIPVDDFLGAVGPYGTGEMRDLRMIVSTDLREDTGWPLSWDVRRIEANSMSGSYVESVTVDTLNGNRIIDYVYDGESWYLEQRQWREVGDLTGWSVLPLEIMLTRQEPSITANVLRDHQDEIPDEGEVVFSGSFEIRDELREAAALVPLAEAVEGVVEVTISDGNLVSTSYRLVDRQLGLHSHVPKIEWIHIRRLDRYDAGHFLRPAGFEPDRLQYVEYQSFNDDLEFIERFDHQDGIGERFELAWSDGLVEVTVRPSRGLSHDLSRGDEWPISWEVERMLVNGYPVIMSGADYGEFPQAAVWDTRRYRYEIRVDPDGGQVPEDWGMGDVREIATAFLEAEPRQGGWRWIGP
jgi:hypothetical protein